MLVKHWWLVIKARDSSCGNLDKSICSNHPNIWYHFGFNKENGLKGAIRFCRYGSYELADLFGQKSGGNTHEKPETLKRKSIKTSISKAV